MNLRNIALVTFHDARRHEGNSSPILFTENDGAFSVKAATHRDYIPTVWWVAQKQVRRYTEERTGVALLEVCSKVTANAFGAFTWYSPHAFSVFSRVMHWDKMQLPENAVTAQHVLAAGIVDIIDLFYTPEGQRSTLTRDDRDRANIVLMASVLPALTAGPLVSAESQATFLLRMCYAAAGMTIDF